MSVAVLTYSEDELKVFQRLLDYYRSLPEASLLAFTVQFFFNLTQTCVKLAEKGILRMEEVPAREVEISVDLRGLDPDILSMIDMDRSTAIERIANHQPIVKFVSHVELAHVWAGFTKKGADELVRLVKSGTLKKN